MEAVETNRRLVKFIVAAVLFFAWGSSSRSSSGPGTNTRVSGARTSRYHSRSPCSCQSLRMGLADGGGTNLLSGADTHQ